MPLVHNQRSNSAPSPADPAMSAVRSTAPHLLRRLQEGVSKFELVYTPHSRWPLPHPRLSQPTNSTNRLRISILDSSFNPPTLAHLSLANSHIPQAPSIRTESFHHDYDAKLLLLSVKNADKTLKPGDARYEQRLEMMSLLAKSLNALNNTTHASAPDSGKSLSPEEATNVAIGIVDEPTFVGKSSIILASLTRLCSTLSPPMTNPPDVELTFLVGLDTLERLFAPRYYSSQDSMLESLRKFLSSPPDGEDSRIVCAHRASSGNEPDEKALSLAKEYIESGRIVMTDIGDEVSTYSSTTVRRSVGSTGENDGSAGSWSNLVTKDIAEYIIENRLYETVL